MVLLRPQRPTCQNRRCVARPYLTRRDASPLAGLSPDAPSCTAITFSTRTAARCGLLVVASTVTVVATTAVEGAMYRISAELIIGGDLDAVWAVATDVNRW